MRDIAWWSSLHGAKGVRGRSFGCSRANVPGRCTGVGPQGTITREMG